MTVLLAVGQMEVGDGLGVAWTPDRVIVASAPASVSKGEVYVAVGFVVGEDEGDDDEDEEDVAGDVALFDMSLSLSLPLSVLVGEDWDAASDSVSVQSISNFEYQYKLNQIRNIPPFFVNPTPNPTESPMTAATSTPSATHRMKNFFFPIPCCTGGPECPCPCPCPCPYPFCAGYPNPGPCRNTASRPGWVWRSGTASLKESPVVVAV